MSVEAIRAKSQLWAERAWPPIRAIPLQGLKYLENPNSRSRVSRAFPDPFSGPEKVPDSPLDFLDSLYYYGDVTP